MSGEDGNEGGMYRNENGERERHVSGSIFIKV